MNDLCNLAASPVFPKPATLRFRVSKLARFEQRFDINFDAVLACSEARSRMRSDQPKRASFSVARKADVNVTRGILQRLVRDR